MIELEFVLKVQNSLIAVFGGEEGLRDLGLLDAALKRTFSII